MASGGQRLLVEGSSKWRLGESPKAADFAEGEFVPEARAWATSSGRARCGVRGFLRRLGGPMRRVAAFWVGPDRSLFRLGCPGIVARSIGVAPTHNSDFGNKDTPMQEPPHKGASTGLGRRCHCEWRLVSVGLLMPPRGARHCHTPWSSAQAAHMRPVRVR